MKYLLMLDTPFWLCVTVVMATWNFRLRKRIAGLNDPRLYLSKGERRGWARQQLQQQKEDEDAEQLERITKIISPTNPYLKDQP